MNTRSSENFNVGTTTPPSRRLTKFWRHALQTAAIFGFLFHALITFDEIHDLVKGDPLESSWPALSSSALRWIVAFSTAAHLAVFPIAAIGWSFQFRRTHLRMAIAVLLVGVGLDSYLIKAGTHGKPEDWSDLSLPLSVILNAPAILLLGSVFLLAWYRVKAIDFLR